jgi:hypothetical protein
MRRECTSLVDVAVPRYLVVQLIPPGLLGVPVSVTGSNVENLAAGRLRSSTGSPEVRVTTPVACRARKVDVSEWFPPGSCPPGSPLALPHNQPFVIGWIAADAVPAVAMLIPAAAAVATVTVAKRLKMPMSSLRIS